MKHISIVHGPYDDDLHEIKKGYLVADRDAMYITEGKLWFLRVNGTTMENVYTQVGGHILLDDTDRGDVVIREVMEKLKGMNAHEFLSIYVINSRTAIDFDLIKL